MRMVAAAAEGMSGSDLREVVRRAREARLEERRKERGFSEAVRRGDEAGVVRELGRIEGRHWAEALLKVGKAFSLKGMRFNHSVSGGAAKGEAGADKRGTGEQGWQRTAVEEGEAGEEGGEEGEEEEEDSETEEGCERGDRE